MSFPLYECNIKRRNFSSGGSVYSETGRSNLTGHYSSILAVRLKLHLNDLEKDIEYLPTSTGTDKTDLARKKFK